MCCAATFHASKPIRLESVPSLHYVIPGYHNTSRCTGRWSIESNGSICHPLGDNFGGIPIMGVLVAPLHGSKVLGTFLRRHAMTYHGTTVVPEGSNWWSVESNGSI